MKVSHLLKFISLSGCVIGIDRDVEIKRRAAEFLQSNEECRYGLEVMLIQDGSTSFDPLIKEMKTTIKTLIEKIQSTFGPFAFGVSSFVDKPTPDRGLGAWGGWQHYGAAKDYCYKLFQPVQLGLSAEQAIDSITIMEENLGSGLDFPEAPLEGLLRMALDKDSGFSPPDKTHDVLGRPIVRVAFLVTDDISHLPNESYWGTWHYNNPREFDTPALSGWGSPEFLSYVYRGRPVGGGAFTDDGLYMELSALLSRVDAGETLSSDEEQRLQQLTDRFGPPSWPEPVAHPGDDSLPCEAVEYPTPEQVGVVLNKQRIYPIFLTGANPEGFGTELQKACRAINMSPGPSCLAQIFRDYMTKMNVMGVAAPLTASGADELFSRIMDSLLSLVELVCLKPTTTAAPTTPAAETTAVLTTETPMAPQNSLLPPPEVPTTLPEPLATKDVNMPFVSKTFMKPDIDLPSVTVPKTYQLPNIDLPSAPTELPTHQSRVANLPTADLATEPRTYQSRNVNLPTAHFVSHTYQAPNIDLPSAPEERSYQAPNIDLPSAPTPLPTYQSWDVGLPTAHFVSHTYQAPNIDLPSAPDERTYQVPDIDLPSAPTLEAVTYQSRNVDMPTITRATVKVEPTVVMPTAVPPAENSSTTTEGGAGGGPPVGVIVGSAAGGVGAIAAGLLWGKGALAGLARSSVPSMMGAEQVEVPEQTVERETMEEVTMDMFQ